MKRQIREPKAKSHPDDPDGETMTLQEVAEHLDCSYAKVLLLVMGGDLSAFRLANDGDGWRVRRSNLEKFAKKQVRPAESKPGSRKQKPPTKKPAPRKGRSRE